MQDQLRPQTSQPTMDAKWAAVVNDQLYPMPRRRLKARVILEQTGLGPGLALVRDFNSPNDLGFEPDVLVDLAEGNVFRAESVCSLVNAVSAATPPKLAFVVDDHWELTVQPHQTGSTLRGLFALSGTVLLFRDFESPTDIAIDDDSHVDFADGPVFVTQKGASNGITIIVEATPHEWLSSKIAYGEVVTLFDPTYPQHPELTYSVRYKKGPKQNPEGILAPGASVKVKEGMVFNVSSTCQS